MKKYPADELSNNPELLPMFIKLLNWFKVHPNTAQYITLCQYTNKLDPKYFELRESCLKHQIRKGFKLISQFEATINNTAEGINEVAEKPHLDMAHMHEYHYYWQQICQQNFFIQLLKFDLLEIRNEVLIQNKQSVAHLVSLLVSLDAVPLNFIPIIKYSGLDLSNEEIFLHSRKCLLMQKKIEKIKHQNNGLYNAINNLYVQFNDINNFQETKIHHMVMSFMENYDKNTGTLKYGCDSSPFFNFIAHPKGIVFQDVKNYLCYPSLNSYIILVSKIMNTFKITDQDEISVIHSLCSLSFAPYCLPEIKTNGKGSHDNSVDLMFFGLQLFSLCDPIESLKFISDNMQKPNDALIKQVISSLEIFTTEWRTLVQYIVNFAIEEYLFPKLRRIRSMLMNQLQ